MKNIQISDETYELLMELSKERGEEPAQFIREALKVSKALEELNKRGEAFHRIHKMLEGRI